MKKVVALSCLFSLILSSCFKKMAQSRAADPSDQQVMLKRNFSDDIINQLKNTQTVFFYKKDNIAALDSFQTSHHQ